MASKSPRDGGTAPAPGQDRQSQGETLPRRNERAEPRLPHERDESSSSHGGTDDPRVKQASRDLKEGQLDTGRSPVVDELARKHFSSGKDADGKDEDRKPDDVR